MLQSLRAYQTTIKVKEIKDIVSHIRSVGHPLILQAMSVGNPGMGFDVIQENQQCNHDSILSRTRCILDQCSNFQAQVPRHAVLCCLWAFSG